MVRATFIDPDFEAALDRDGYAVVPFLTETDVETLIDAYDRLGRAPG